MEIEKKIILKLARKAIKLYLTTNQYLSDIPELYQDDKISDIYLDKRSCFVTLKTNEGNLRGCIGNTVATDALYKNIIQYAVAAATQDPRFMPVKAAELDNLKIEVSILTIPEPLENLDDFVIGLNGLIIKHQNNSGLLLPQVATEYDLGKTQFLEHVSQKSGLNTNAYLDADAKLFKFSAEIFSED